MFPEGRNTNVVTAQCYPVLFAQCYHALQYYPVLFAQCYRVQFAECYSVIVCACVQNLRTAAQSKDQTLSRGNQSLVRSQETGRPVRVVRGYKLKSVYAPESGYRYDGQ